MKLVEVKHPLVKHKLGVMREADIDTKKFRELATEVGSLLTYEATADLETEKVLSLIHIFVHNRHEEIRGTDNCSTITKIINRSVIRCFISH